MFPMSAVKIHLGINFGEKMDEFYNHDSQKQSRNGNRLGLKSMPVYLSLNYPNASERKRSITIFSFLSPD